MHQNVASKKIIGQNEMTADWNDCVLVYILLIRIQIHL